MHNHYNEYREFSDRETEAHMCAAFMYMSGMATLDGKICMCYTKLIQNYDLNCSM